MLSESVLRFRARCEAFAAQGYCNEYEYQRSCFDSEGGAGSSMTRKLIPYELYEAMESVEDANGSRALYVLVSGLLIEVVPWIQCVSW
jgi:hypothetical protein